MSQDISLFVLKHFLCCDEYTSPGLPFHITLCFTPLPASTDCVKVLSFSHFTIVHYSNQKENVSEKGEEETTSQTRSLKTRKAMLPQLTPRRADQRRAR